MLEHENLQILMVTDYLLFQTDGKKIVPLANDNLNDSLVAFVGSSTFLAAIHLLHSLKFSFTILIVLVH